MSHKPPTPSERAVEVPLKLKRHLGLDEKPSWIYTDQVNEFAWAGPDLRPADRLSTLPQARDTCVIGKLPTDWFELLKQDVMANLRQRKSQIVPRTK